MLNISVSQRRASEREDGFTIVELMIVVVIIGILAAISVPVFSDQQKSAEDAILKQDIKAMSNAIVTWQTKGEHLDTIEYVDEEEQYIIKVNAGDRNAWPVISHPSGKQLFAGLYDFNVSDGTRIAVKMVDPNIGFCIAGARDDSNYDSDSGTDTNDITKTLFYDSVTGKTTPLAGLTDDGACAYYLTL